MSARIISKNPTKSFEGDSFLPVFFLFSYAGIGAEISARVMEHETFFHLDAPVWRVTGVDGPMPYAKNLEAAAIPVPADVVHAVKQVLRVK